MNAQSSFHVPSWATGDYMKLRYFGWVRERIGRAEEQLDPPQGVDTITELISWLRLRGPEYEAALDDAMAIRAAINKVHVGTDATLERATEVALFPPMTGG